MINKYLILISFVLFFCACKKDIIYNDITPEEVKIVVNSINKRTQFEPKFDSIYNDTKYAGYMLFYSWNNNKINIEIGYDYRFDNTYMNNLFWIEYKLKNKDIIDPIVNILDITNHSKIKN